MNEYLLLSNRTRNCQYHKPRPKSCRVDRGGVERGGFWGVGVHVRDIVLERKRGNADDMVASAGAENKLPIEQAPQPPLVEYGTVAGIRLLHHER